jgi:hypothetical protein
MSAPFTQNATDASNASGPIFEDITELCDFCIKLAEAIVTDPGTSPDERDWLYTFENMIHGSGAETCRLCEMITGDVSARRLQLGIEGSPLTPMDWKKSSPKMLRLYSAEICGGPMVDPRQICGARIDNSDYSMWADEGAKHEVPHSSPC